eukprot:TRINITY_DN33287_c0_g1_i4.p1 TRINITY_DN33287_c0_g1~~TRINITY_DN33287_c0_g1_i4.p1  ORF type:complete len:267 (+),score=40.20 TRINITY_DN33287_c0_g1_i4:60-860(+)
MENFATREKIFDAVKSDNVKLVKEFLKSGGDVNLTEERDSLLHLAVEHGAYKSMVVLLNAGANTNLKNARGETPLELARKFSNRQGCILAIQLTVRRRKERLKEEDKRHVLLQSCSTGGQPSTSSAVNLNNGLKNLDTLLRLNLESAQNIVQNLEFEASRAKSVVKGLEHQLIVLDSQMKFLNLQNDSSSNSSQSPITDARSYEDFKCMICWDVPGGHIFQCTEGHLLCGECFSNPQISVCPECRVPLDTRIRNRAVEKLLSDFRK